MTSHEFHRWVASPHRRPLVMGVINVTPDSFSDGGEFFDPAAAIAAARQMITDGADLIDIGGESTRPGADRIPADEQIRRIMPVIRDISPSVAVSVDTTLPTVASAALDNGACLINDVSAGNDDEKMPGLIAKHQCPIILMHMQGSPETMQNNPVYTEVVREVRENLLARGKVFENAGVSSDKILIDPGIGFGKAFEHNLSLLKHLDQLVACGYPVLIGTSRKRFIGTILNEPDPCKRIFGTAATVAWSVMQGASIVRVHDVAEICQIVKVIQAIRHSD